MYELFIPMQESLGLFTNVEKAGIIGLLITAIIYFVREKNRQEKEINSERESRLKELKDNANQMNELLQKVIATNAENVKETYSIINKHEENMASLLKEQIERIEAQIKLIEK